MSTTTPNMNLIESTINDDSGLTWEENLNKSLDIIDQHNHTSGNGVQIPPAGININAQLTFNNQQATGLQAVSFTQQATLATLNAVFVGTDGNLYFNDGAGDASIQMTKDGSVKADSSGISSGTASASFSGGVLQVFSAANTPANIQAGSILIGNNVANSKYATLSAPSSLAANYGLTLPLQPASTLLMTLDSSGNMGTVANATIADTLAAAMTSTGANNIAATMTSTGTDSIIATAGAAGAQTIATNMGSTGAATIASNMTVASSTVISNKIFRGSGSAAGNISLLALNSTYTNSTTSPTLIGTVTLTVSSGQNPMIVTFVPDKAFATPVISLTHTGVGGLAVFTLYDGGSPVNSIQVGSSNINGIEYFSPSSIQFWVFNTLTPPGTVKTLSIYGNVSAASTSLSTVDIALIAYELH